MTKTYPLPPDVRIAQVDAAPGSALYGGGSCRSAGRAAMARPVGAICTSAPLTMPTTDPARPKKPGT